MIEIYLKHDNMHIFGMINAFNCINNHVISCISSMLSMVSMIFMTDLTIMIGFMLILIICMEIIWS